MADAVPDDVTKAGDRAVQDSSRLHGWYRGKMQTMPKCLVRGLADFALWYTPGVAAPCREIEKDPDVKVEWVSWEGRPPGQDFAGYSPEQKQENYETNHKPLADKYGVPINLAGGNYRTTNAHLATYYARDNGKLIEFRLALGAGITMHADPLALLMR